MRVIANPQVRPAGQKNMSERTERKESEGEGIEDGEKTVRILERRCWTMLGGGNGVDGIETLISTPEYYSLHVYAQ